MQGRVAPDAWLPSRWVLSRWVSRRWVSSCRTLRGASLRQPEGGPPTRAADAWLGGSWVDHLGSPWLPRPTVAGAMSVVESEEVESVAVAVVVVPNARATSSHGRGRCQRYPCAWSQPASTSASATSWDSTPTAVTRHPRLWPRSMNERT